MTPCQLTTPQNTHMIFINPPKYLNVFNSRNGLGCGFWTSRFRYIGSHPFFSLLPLYKYMYYKIILWILFIILFLPVHTTLGILLHTLSFPASHRLTAPFTRAKFSPTPRERTSPSPHPLPPPHPHLHVIPSPKKYLSGQYLSPPKYQNWQFQTT